MYSVANIAMSWLLSVRNGKKWGGGQEALLGKDLNRGDLLGAVRSYGAKNGTILGCNNPSL